jgi:hypothetical protein
MDGDSEKREVNHRMEDALRSSQRPSSQTERDLRESQMDASITRLLRKQEQFAIAAAQARAIQP